MNLDITEKWAKEIALMSDADFEENCKHIETLLNRRKQALRIHDVITCSECGNPFQKKEIIIQGDIDTCDDCLCPE